MTELAVGYVAPAATVPTGMGRVRADEVAILTVPLAMGATPEDRLRACLAVQATAGGFLPFGPRQRVTVCRARALAKRAGSALADMLARVEGMAEAVLRIDAVAAPRIDCGAQWLRRRHAALDANRRRMEALAALATGLRAVATRPLTGRPALALLAPRDVLAEAEARLTPLCAEWPRELGTGLSVLAPCPAFHFAVLPEAA